MSSRYPAAPRRRALFATSFLVPVLTLAAAPVTRRTGAALPTIVVSPTGTATPIDQTASSVTVITAADIEREQRRTVPDALSLVPGLNVVQTGGPGGIDLGLHARDRIPITSRC